MNPIPSRTARILLALGLATLGSLLRIHGAELFSIQESASLIEIGLGDSPVLVYHKAEVPPPEGATPEFARSGFIHPLYSPSGGIVTSVHAPDHIHHMGLWHAWVKTTHNGRELDFWNPAKKQATVRYAETLDTQASKTMAGFIVLQEHVALPEGTNDQATVILSETLTVVIREADGRYLMDYAVTQTNVSEAPLQLAAYRYGGGIAYRAPLQWDTSNSDYLTSERRTREDGHATRARWCAMHGPTDKGVASVAILCHPSNHDAPQRMRIWDNGPVFFNFVPIQETSWSLDPGKPETLRYRIVVADGRPDADIIEGLWQAYAQEP